MIQRFASLRDSHVDFADENGFQNYEYFTLLLHSCWFDWLIIIHIITIASCFRVPTWLWLVIQLSINVNGIQSFPDWKSGTLLSFFRVQCKRAESHILLTDCLYSLRANHTWTVVGIRQSRLLGASRFRYLVCNVYQKRNVLRKLIVMWVTLIKRSGNNMEKQSSVSWDKDDTTEPSVRQNGFHLDVFFLSKRFGLPSNESYTSSLWGYWLGSPYQLIGRY